MSRNLIAFGAAALACAIAGVIVLQRQPARKSALPLVKTAAVFEPPAGTQPPARQELPPPPATAAAPEITLPQSPAPAEIPKNKQGPSAAQNKKPAGTRKDPITDPLARVALSLVGADLEAERYWFSAINNPDLPANERQDLIEDLNEEGFAEPKHPTQDDLPLILSRIELIEEVWPWAPDQINWDAFAEAYKDLVNMANLANGGGLPVK